MFSHLSQKPYARLLISTLLFTTPILSCLHYQGTAPWDDHQPFEATITDSGIITCWISQTYASHYLIQSQTALKRTPENKYMDWEFQPWIFECLEGYKARAEIGRRSYSYRAQGQDFFWVAEIREDIGGEAYVFKKELFCKSEKGKEGGNKSGGGKGNGERKQGVVKGNGNGSAKWKQSTVGQARKSRNPWKDGARTPGKMDRERWKDGVTKSGGGSGGTKVDDSDVRVTKAHELQPDRTAYQGMNGDLEKSEQTVNELVGTEEVTTVKDTIEETGKPEVRKVETDNKWVKAIG